MAISVFHRRLVAVAILATLPACDGAGSAARLLRPDDAAVVASGEALYALHCAVRHGAQLEGQPDWRQLGPDSLLPAPPHDETGHSWHHPDQVLFDLTKYGPAYFEEGYASAMPAFEDILTDAEIIAVLAFIKSSWSDLIRARQAAIDAQAAE